MADLKEQRICIKFCFNIEKTATETHQMIEDAFGENAMSKNQTFLWYERFRDGRTSVDEDGEEPSNQTGKKKSQKNSAKVRKTISSPDGCKKTQTKKK